uniref:Viral A-type inclusion protein n=1 Tax=Parastrongyloides trichosuri TaxID=131310 RepID=A0A0N4Z6F8_PARTI
MAKENDEKTNLEESIVEKNLKLSQKLKELEDIKKKEKDVEEKKRHLESLKDQLREKQIMIEEIAKLSKNLSSDQLTEDGKLSDETISKVKQNLEEALLKPEPKENSSLVKEKEAEKMNLQEAVKYLEIKLSSDSLLSDKNKEQIETIQASVNKIKENEKRLREDLDKRMQRRDEIVKELARSQEVMKERMKNIEDLKAQLAAIKALKDKKEQDQENNEN